MTGFQMGPMETKPAGQVVMALHNDAGQLVFWITADGRWHLAEGWTTDAAATLFADIMNDQLRAQAEADNAAT